MLGTQRTKRKWLEISATIKVRSSRKALTTCSRLMLTPMTVNFRRMISTSKQNRTLRCLHHWTHITTASSSITRTIISVTSIWWAITRQTTHSWDILPSLTSPSTPVKHLLTYRIRKSETQIISSNSHSTITAPWSTSETTSVPTYLMPKHSRSGGEIAASTCSRLMFNIKTIVNMRTNTERIID